MKRNCRSLSYQLQSYDSLGCLQTKIALLREYILPYFLKVSKCWLLPGIDYPKKLKDAGCDFIDKVRLEVRWEVGKSDVTLFEPHLCWLSTHRWFDESWNRRGGDDVGNGVHLAQVEDRQ